MSPRGGARVIELSLCHNHLLIPWRVLLLTGETLAELLNVFKGSLPALFATFKFPSRYLLGMGREEMCSDRFSNPN